jgi:hypothetical protein
MVVAMIVLVTAGAFGIDPANLNRVTFVNSTGYDFIYLFFSPGDSEYWGADVLGTTRTLDDGEAVSFFIHYPDYANEFDFLAIDEDGDAYIIWNYEISDAEPALIEVTLGDFEGGYDLPDLAEVSLTNSTGYDMWYVMFSPGDSEMWGIDMLDDETILEAGATLSLFVPVSDTPIRFDVHTVDEDIDSYEFQIELSNARLEYSYAIEPGDLQ